MDAPQRPVRERLAHLPRGGTSHSAPLPGGVRLRLPTRGIRAYGQPELDWPLPAESRRRENPFRCFPEGISLRRTTSAIVHDLAVASTSDLVGSIASFGRSTSLITLSAITTLIDERLPTLVRAVSVDRV